MDSFSHQESSTDSCICLLQPLHVVCPEQYTQPPLTQSHRSDLMLELQPPPMPYRRCSVLNLPFRRRYERIYILPEVSHMNIFLFNSSGYKEPNRLRRQCWIKIKSAPLETAGECILWSLMCGRRQWHTAYKKLSELKRGMYYGNTPAPVWEQVASFQV